jgi:hypothetical protein
MAIIATETQKLSNTVKQELWADLAYCRVVATANETGAKTYKIGDVVGITAAGKVKLAVETAVDGTKVFYGIVLEDKAVPAATDTKVLVARRGPMSVRKAAVFLDATYNDDAKKNVVYAAIEAAGIQLLETV